MLLETLLLTEKDLKPFVLQFDGKPPYIDDEVDFCEDYGTISKKGVGIEDTGNNLFIQVDFSIDYEVKRSRGDYYTPSYTEFRYTSVSVWNWNIIDDDNNEIETDTVSDAKLELAVKRLLEDTYY